MSVKTLLDDTNGNGQARIIKAKKDMLNGLMVYTEPVRTTTGQTKLFLNPDNGANMNIDASFSGTPINVHNGIDNTYWTGSALSGTWTFNSTDFAHAGTRSIKGKDANNNHVAQLEHSTTISTGSYVALSGWIYIEKWDTDGSVKEVELELRNAGTLIGNFINMSNYIDSTNFGVWQKFAIPISDFGATTSDFDQLWIRNRDEGGGKAPDFYLDDIQFEESAGQAIYTMEPDNGTILRVEELQFSFAGPYDSTLANASAPNIKYNQILGLTALSVGITLRRKVGDDILFTGTFRQHTDFIQFPSTWQFSGDGTNSSITYYNRFLTPLILDSDSQDRLEILVSDDLSSLLHFRVIVRGSTEIIDHNSTK